MRLLHEGNRPGNTKPREALKHSERRRSDPRALEARCGPRMPGSPQLRVPDRKSQTNWTNTYIISGTNTYIIYIYGLTDTHILFQLCSPVKARGLPPLLSTTHGHTLLRKYGTYSLKVEVKPNLSGSLNVPGPLKASC